MSDKKLARAQIISMGDSTFTQNPWKVTPSGMKSVTSTDFYNLVTKCRFYYKKDPLTSTTINKLIEIGINDLRFSKNGLSDNEFRVFTGIKQDLLGFAEAMALEYLISGLVIPEIKYGSKSKEDIKKLGVKKYETLTLPESMWVRDPTTIEVNSVFAPDRPSYFVIIPDKLVSFILMEGKYSDGTEDKQLYSWLKTYYPEFVNTVKEGNKKVLLDNDLIIRRKVLSDSPYPIPYLNAAIDILEHKRNLRKADFSVAVKVLSSILHVKVGSDEFPMTESEEDSVRLLALQEQLTWRNRSTMEVDNIFQLFTDHTVEMKWVFPDVTILLNDTKYGEVNQEIIFSLGFPRILISGESEKSNTSDPEMASIAPINTMNNFRSKILEVIKDVVYNVATRNNFSSIPGVAFAPINLHSFQNFITALGGLFDKGGISRTSMDEIFGYNFDDELEKRKAEQKKLVAAGVPEFAPAPFSREPTITGNKKDSEEDTEDDTNEEETNTPEGKIANKKAKIGNKNGK